MCRLGDAPDNPLFYPCHCKGSIRFVHQDCLTKWLEHRQSNVCELCGYQFSFRPLLKEGAPQRLSSFDLFLGPTFPFALSQFDQTTTLISVLLVLSGLSKRFFLRLMPSFLRGALATFAWALALPLLSLYCFRLCGCASVSELFGIVSIETAAL